jgi:hypothetical protein
VRLSAQVVNLIGSDRLDELIEGRGVGQIGVRQSQPHIRLVGILVDMIDPAGVERRRSADRAKYFVTLSQ